MKSTSRITRRLLAGLATAAALMISSLTLAADPAYRGISVQLWSVKEDVTKDVKGTLKALADMGFDGVELAGNLGEFGDDAAAFKAYTDSLGLEISGAHVGFDQLSPENIDRTIDFYKTLGVEWLIIPADGRAWSEQGIDSIVAQLNETARRLAPHGMRIGYHNHQDEFNDYAGSNYWEYLLANTRDEVLVQLDISWAYFAGQDPVDLIRRYGDRIGTVHIKSQMTHYDEVMPAIEQAAPANWGEKMGVVFEQLNKVTNADNGLSSIVGQDLIDWQAVVDQLARSPEPVWLVIEQEVYPEGMTPMQAVAASKKGLDAYL